MERIREAMLSRRAYLLAEIAALQARVAELDHWLDVPAVVGAPIPPTFIAAPVGAVTRARTPRAIKRQTRS